MPANEDKQNDIVAAAGAPAADAVIPDLAGDNTIIDKAVERIRKAESILIALSKDPSVDEISAALSFSMLLDSLGKHATAIYSGTTPNALEFLRPDETFEKTTDSLQDFIVILNKSKADHLHYKIEGDFVKVYITPYKTKITESDIEFDHGDYNVDLVVAFDVESGDALDDALSNYGRIMHDATAINITTSAPGRFAEIEWSDPSASSVCEMVSVLAKKLGVTNYTQEIATALLTGIISATERFSNNRTTSVTMALAAELMTAGADQQLVSEHVLKAVEKPAEEAKAEASAETAEAPAEEKPAEEAAPAKIENAQDALEAAQAAAEKAEAEAPKEEEEAKEPVDLFATAPEMPQPSVEAVAPAAPAAPAAPVMPPAPAIPAAPELPAAPVLPAAPTAPVPPVMSAPANPNETTPIAEDTTPTNGTDFVVSGNADSPALNPSNVPMRATNPPMMAQAVEAMPQAVGVPAANATPMMSNNPAVNAAPAVPTSPLMNFPQIGSHEGAIQQNLAEPVEAPKDMSAMMAAALAEPQPVVLDSSNIKGPIASNDIDESPLAQVQQPMPANTTFTGQNPAMLAAPTVPQAPAANISNIPTMYAAPQSQPAQPFANQNSIQSAMNAIINPSQDPQTPAGAVAQLEQMVAAPAQTAGMPAQLANELTAPQAPQAPAAPALPLPNLNAPAPTPAIDFSGMPPVAPVAPVAPTPIVVDPTQAPAAAAPEAPVAPAMPEAPAAPVLPAAPDVQAVPQAPQAPQAPAADAAAFHIPGM